ncbi:response regulator [bacterium]|nr:response regulator [bacterium]
MILSTLRRLLSILTRFAERQSAEEVARQYAVILREELHRRVLVVLAFATAAIYLPWGLCLGLLAVEFGGELAGLRLMSVADPQRRPGRYLAMLACYVVSQIAYCLVPALIWQTPDPLAKAFAVGSILVTLIHVSTIRTVHLPLALTGGLVVIAVTILANVWYWLSLGHSVGLAISSLCVLASAHLTVRTMLSLHRLYDEMRRERAAAQAADQTKLRFLAQMSHELRTPLNAILGMGTAELAGARTDEQRDRLSILVQSARSLSVMLDDILDLSAMQAGQLPIRPQPLDLPAEVAAIVAMFRQQIADAGLMLRFSMHESVPHHARLDGQRLRQCLCNILSNAVKHTRQGLISVFVYESRPGMLAIKVTDSGPGVPEELHEKIFEPFYRGQLNIPGTGLGMSIARTLARRMGGDLVLLPSVSGAHFLLTLQIGPASQDEVPVAEPPTRSALAGVRVLVVDDIATNRLVASTYLRLLGASPVEAAGGAAALDELSGADPPQIVLLDLLMPDMDGAETLRRIRSLPGIGTRIAVVAMSADVQDRNTAQGTAGFDGHVTKPLSEAGLLAVLVPLTLRRVAGLPNRLPV